MNSRRLIASPDAQYLDRSKLQQHLGSVSGRTPSMSALGQTQTCALQLRMSAVGQKQTLVLRSIISSTALVPGT